MGEGRKDGMVSHGETDTGFYHWFTGVIAGYPGHLLGIALAQIMTCPSGDMELPVRLGAQAAQRSWLLTAPPGSLGRRGGFLRESNPAKKVKRRA